MLNQLKKNNLIFIRVINRLTGMSFKKTFLIGFFGLLLKC